MTYSTNALLDKNSLRALRCDDDEDDHMPFNSNPKQKQKQEALKKFIPGDICVVCG
jgi:hypothetical protein